MAMPASVSAVQRCRLCRCALDPDEADDMARAICSSCSERPEAKRLLVGVQVGANSKPSANFGARDFTPAERGMIRKLHGYMPAQQLLALLNERLACDLGPDAAPYTLDQLHAEIGESVAAGGAGDWASLRKLIALARRDGTLEHVSAEVIDTFAVIFALNPAQAMRLKDVVLAAKDGGDR